MEGDRVGRRQAAIGAPAAADDAERADARRFVAGAGEDLAGEGGDRGLAAGAGDGDELLRLAPVEARRHQRQRPARIVRDDEGDAGVGIHLGVLAGEDGDGAALHRIGDKAGAIGGRCPEARRTENRARPRGCRRRVPRSAIAAGSGRNHQIGSGEVPKEHSSLSFRLCGSGLRPQSGTSIRHQDGSDSPSSELRLDPEQRRRAADDGADRRRGVGGRGRGRTFFLRLRFVKHDENDILRVVHREGGEEGIEPLVVGIAAVDRPSRRCRSCRRRCSPARRPICPSPSRR